MRTVPLVGLLVVVGLFTPQVWAADVPVSYLVDWRTLTANAPAGTALTFTLYNDNACTSQVASQVVNVENVQVIELLRLLTPKGATPAPLTARLTTTLPWGAPVYLVRSIVSRSCRRAPSTSVSGRWRSRLTSSAA